LNSDFSIFLIQANGLNMLNFPQNSSILPIFSQYYSIFPNSPSSSATIKCPEISEFCGFQGIFFSPPILGETPGGVALIP
jgi:hypothetical protein